MADNHGQVADAVAVQAEQGEGDAVQPEQGPGDAEHDPAALLLLLLQEGAAAEERAADERVKDRLTVLPFFTWKQ